MMSQDHTVLTVDGGPSQGGILRKCAVASVVRWRKSWMLLSGLMLGFLLFYVLSEFSLADKFGFHHVGYVVQNEEYSIWPEFRVDPPVSHVYFRSTCVRQGNYSITGLSAIQKEWSESEDAECQLLYEKFTSIFTIEARKATVSLPRPFQKKVRQWLGGNKELYQEVFQQDVIHILSEYTGEHTIFNPLRDKRPVLPPEVSEVQYFNDIMNSTKANCDFCKYRNFTAEHTFGRVESMHAFSASNVFKIDTLHALLALKKHDPLHWSLAEFLDLFQLTDIWLKKAHLNHPRARFPALVWDVLPKCGASQVHPHMHVVLDFHRHHGEVEVWRKAAQDYYVNHNANYFTDLVAIYAALNLTVTYGQAVAFANLVPKKDHEVVVIAETANSDFYQLLYFVLRAFIDDLKKMCFSMGIGLPAFNVSEGRLPAYARVITRGYVTDIRADISSFELFMAANVNIDPFKTIGLVRNSLQQRWPQEPLTDL